MGWAGAGLDFTGMAMGWAWPDEDVHCWAEKVGTSPFSHHMRIRRVRVGLG